MCPACQTLIDTSSQKILFEPIKQEEICLLPKAKKSSEDKNEKLIEEIEEQEEQEPVSTAESGTMEEDITTSLATTMPLTDLEMPDSENSVVNEPIETSPGETEEVKAPNLDLSEESPPVIEEKENLQMEFQCVRYFGYLGKRSKGEGIPEGCFECPKSIDCMLSDYISSKESVEAIKKWYPSSC